MSGSSRPFAESRARSYRDFKELVKEGYRPGFTRVSELDLVVSVSKKVSSIPSSSSLSLVADFIASDSRRSAPSASPFAPCKPGILNSSLERSSTSSYS